MIRVITFILGISLIAASLLSQGGQNPIIAQHFRGTDDVRAAVLPHIPNCVSDECFRHDDPSMINNLCASMTLVNGIKSCESDRLICYLSDAHERGFLQVYGRTDKGWILLAQDSTLHFGILPIMFRADVECDGTPEVVVESSTENDGVAQYDVVSIAGDRIERIEGKLFENIVHGDEVRFAINNTGCVQKVQVVSVTSDDVAPTTSDYVYDASLGRFVSAQ